jgi:hypothetical protein
MRPDTFSKAFPATKREGIRIESRSMQHADPDIIKKISAYGTITKRVESVKSYTKQLASTRYFVILDTPYQRFRGNALVEANAAGCLILAHKNFRSNNSYIIPEENRYQNYTELFELLAQLNQSEELRNKMFDRQHKIITKASYTVPKNAFDKILELHSQSNVTIKLHQWRNHYFPIVCTKLMPFIGVVNSLTTKLTGKPLFEYVAKIINKKGDMF